MTSSTYGTEPRMGTWDSHRQVETCRRCAAGDRGFEKTGRRLTNLGLTPPGYKMSPLRGWGQGIRKNGASSDQPGAHVARLQNVAAARLGTGDSKKRGVV